MKLEVACRNNEYVYFNFLSDISYYTYYYNYIKDEYYESGW